MFRSFSQSILGASDRRLGHSSSVLETQAGFTLIELLVVVTIVGLLAVLTILTIKPWVQLAKSRDSRRMTDLKEIRAAIESYAGDNVCYPDESLLLTCQGSGLSPYLNRLPCDPLTNEPYYYVRPDNCKQFVLYTELEIDNGLPDYGVGNYAVYSGNLTTVPVVVP